MYERIKNQNLSPTATDILNTTDVSASEYIKSLLDILVYGRIYDTSRDEIHSGQDKVPLAVEKSSELTDEMILNRLATVIDSFSNQERQSRHYNELGFIKRKLASYVEKMKTQDGKTDETSIYRLGIGNRDQESHFDGELKIYQGSEHQGVEVIYKFKNMKSFNLADTPASKLIPISGSSSPVR